MTTEEPMRDKIVAILLNEHSLGRGWEYTSAERIIAEALSRTPPVDQDEVERIEQAIILELGRQSVASGFSLEGINPRHLARVASIGSGAGDVREAWQPIETAPQGEEDYVLVIRAGHKIPFVASYDADEKRWWTFNFSHEHVTKQRYEPTHWMPLPEPPALSTDTGSGG